MVDNPERVVRKHNARTIVVVRDYPRKAKKARSPQNNKTIGPGRSKRLEAFRITRPIGLLKLWRNASVSVGVSVEVVLLRVGVNNTGSLSV